MRTGFDEPIRRSAHANGRAFLEQYARAGGGYSHWMAHLHDSKMIDQPIDVQVEALMHLDDQGKARALGPLKTSTSGVFNTIYGASAYAQIVKSANAIGILSNRAVECSGFRAETAQSSTDLPGVEEGTGLPTDAIAAYAEVTVGVKDLAHLTAITFLQQNLENKDDVLASANVIESEKQTFMNRLNRNVLQDVHSGAPATQHMNSLSCLTESYAHINASSGVVPNAADFYDQDRDAAATWADAYVNYNTSAADTPRSFNLAFVDDCIMQTGKYRMPANAPYGEGVILTGFDTEAVLTQHVETKNRLSEKFVTISVNGVKTAPGQEGSIRVNAYKGQPIFLDANVGAPNSGISDMFFLDTSTVSLGVLQPVKFYQGNDIFANDGFKSRYGWHMQANIWLTYPRPNAKLTDHE